MWRGPQAPCWRHPLLPTVFSGLPRRTLQVPRPLGVRSPPVLTWRSPIGVPYSVPEEDKLQTSFFRIYHINQRVSAWGMRPLWGTNDPLTGVT